MAKKMAGTASPKVLLNIRHPGEKFVKRSEDQWPLKKTRWTQLLFANRCGDFCLPNRPCSQEK
jgi:hypothetical protein